MISQKDYFDNINNKINLLFLGQTIKKGSENNVDLIFNKLWLGNYKIANDINFIIDNKISYILNVTHDIPNYLLFIDYTILNVSDDMACEKDLLKTMEYGAFIINNMISNNKSILIHCKRGHHRSASIIALYLMKYHNVKLIDAISIIKKIRPTAFRRMTCMLKTLIQYEYNKLNV